MRRAAKIDSTARELTALARQMGALVWLMNDTIDACIWFRNRLHLVDFKTKRGKKVTLTTDQQSMVDRGWPINFVSTEQQLKDLLLR